jgi:arrestin-related trafficking adapter 4/5/7
MVFISPSLPIDDDNNLVDQSPLTAQRATDDMAHSAPPLYGEHQFDQLYSDVDPSGYFTPAVGTEANTPLGAHSRNISDENLTSMDALTNGNVSAAALRRRLNNLHNNSAGNSVPISPENPPDEDANSRRNTGQPGDYFGGPAPNAERSSPPRDGSGSLSRRTSEEDNLPSGEHTPRPQFMEVEDLCRVPSYSTAVRSNARTQLSDDLPNYLAATRGTVSGPPTPQPPRQAHLRGGWGSPPSPVSALNLPERPPISSHGRRHLGSSPDGERRVTLLQMRARG